MDNRKLIGGIFVFAALAALASRAAYGMTMETEYTPEYAPDPIIPDFAPFEFEYQQEGANVANWKVNEYPKYAAVIADAERANGIPTDLYARQLYQESRYRADVISGAKRSPVGAMGIAQFMPETGEDFGLVMFDRPRGQPGRIIISDLRTDPYASITAGARYMRQLYAMFGNWESALMAYNWGPGNVAKYNRGEKTTLPLETSTYVQQITADVAIA